MAIMTTLGLVKGVAGLYSADAQRRAGYAESKALKSAGRESLVTALYNIRERDKQAKQEKFDIYEKGARALNQVAREGKIKTDAVKAEVSGSGASVSSGTTLDVLMTNAVNNTVEQLSVVNATGDALDNVERTRMNTNKSEWMNAKSMADKYEKQSVQAKKSADDAFTANILSTIVDTSANLYLSGAFKSKPPDTGFKSKLPQPSSNWAKTKKFFGNWWHNAQNANFDPRAGLGSLGKEQLNSSI